MIDLATFRTRAPEFGPSNVSSDTKVQAALDEAEALTDPTIFGALTDLAHLKLACHILASSPQGREASSKNVPQETTYLVERKRLERICCVGYGGTS